MPKFLAAVLGSPGLFEKTASFQPVAAGWHRVMTGVNMMGGTLRISAGTYDSTLTDVELQFNLSGYGLVGSILLTRHSSFNGGIITAARLSTDGVAALYLDLYVSTAVAPTPISLYGYGPNMPEFFLGGAPVAGVAAGPSNVEVLDFSGRVSIVQGPATTAEPTAATDLTNKGYVDAADERVRPAFFVDHRAPGLRITHDFADEPNGAAPALSEQGLTYQHTGSPLPTIVGGALTNAGVAGNIASYSNVNLGQKVTRIGARFRFTPGSTHGGLAVLVIWARLMGGAIPSSPCHFTVSDTVMQYGTWVEGIGLTVHLSVTLAAPLAVDGTVHTIEVAIDGEDATVWVNNIAYGVSTPEIDGAGPVAGWEVYQTDAATDPKAQFLEIWAAAGLPEQYVWVQTRLGADGTDMTFWVEDGLP